jgi:diaminopropionate ammonia-lyase
MRRTARKFRRRFLPGFATQVRQTPSKRICPDFAMKIPTLEPLTRGRGFGCNLTSLPITIGLLRSNSLRFTLSTGVAMTEIHPPDESPRDVFRLWGDSQPTPLLALPELARRYGVAAVWVKDEGRRPLGSFKALGGMYAGLRALVRATKSGSVGALLAARTSERKLPTLICASDGNHGLAVAAGAELAGAPARVYLHSGVPQSRAKRIADRGAEIVWIEGSYDDAVDAAFRAVERGEGLLISDTSPHDDDPVTAYIMAGYGLMADEITSQLQERNEPPPTHLFVQAGVGGLAAALGRGLCETHGLKCRIVVVEPAGVDCVGDALRRGTIERLPGDLHTAAEMLSCGEPSAPAITILKRLQADAISVSERELIDAVDFANLFRGPPTTPSGATGLAGFMSALPGTKRAEELQVDSRSRILWIATEGPIPEAR